jgi:hypothetical protein
LSGNDQIFKNTPPSPPLVAAKEKSILIETMANHSFKNKNTLLPKEKKWIVTFTFRDRKKIHCLSLHHSRMVIVRYRCNFSSMVEDVGYVLYSLHE